ncbi:histidine kinase [Ruania halotolerans]|uniref:histidine kinase n=1 Tax=Ruania halotolerans TaxID=2897773 RepID=UPI001E4B27A9|nr:histidine kinase [Ruania halotolerans]UFU07419.1 histidine kinase [Ruania halotolerans]
MTMPVAPPVPVSRPPEAPRVRTGLRAFVLSASCSVLGALVFLVTFGMTLEENEGVLPGALSGLIALDVVTGLAAGIAVGPLRHSRTGNLLLVIAASLSAWAVPAGLVALVRIGTRRSYAWDGAALAIMATGSLGMTWAHAGTTGQPMEVGLTIAALVMAGAVAVAALMWGRARGTRAALMTSLREQAAAAERERQATAQSRDASVAQARADERRAIARDMHDSLSHQLSLIAMHAAALSYRDDLSPEQVRAAARTVHECAGEANAVLREVLAALRESDTPEVHAPHDSPLPTASSIDALADEARADGQQVSVTWRAVTAEEVQHRSPATSVSVARICSELLMNARKHAPGAPVEIMVEHTGADLALQVTNPVTQPDPARLGTGLGLVGVAERARILGGTAYSGRTAQGLFEVEVRIPWTG